MRVGDHGPPFARFRCRILFPSRVGACTRSDWQKNGCPISGFTDMAGRMLARRSPAPGGGEEGWLFLGSPADAPIAEPESMDPESTAIKSTRPSGSGDPAQNSTGHGNSGSALGWVRLPRYLNGFTGAGCSAPTCPTAIAAK